MLRLIEVLDSSGDGDAASPSVRAGGATVELPMPVTSTPSPPSTLTLAFADRRRSRQLVTLDDGRPAALMLPRGTVLRDGTRLRPEGGGPAVTVRAAPETLSRVRAADPRLLARAAYHLGNRHVPVQVGTGWLAYEHDHVLDDLVRRLGVEVESITAPFEPEGGGYATAGGHHHHGDHHAPDPDHRDHDHHHSLPGGGHGRA